ncbi:MAG: D-alanyl-D-alanine carboxypeptidase/D-alanyl-D-alanine-endopeptidase [Betaproteobacteria bacterium HGW-Betaproteobacteria-3]|jgi:D-alanyl-D-alanine carboxypeptidase/D-alanyl-D-alanine-endopeptidase (penicillin-binding protein 4)|nr:MAG: D-alanyl-D-alanine carboxypeptidase/D-alanyl-D-alanine-endopeptidase [Betaproteobacteria bacterium HGW-Betaproteobacteria-3]
MPAPLAVFIRPIVHPTPRPFARHATRPAAGHPAAATAPPRADAHGGARQISTPKHPGFRRWKRALGFSLALLGGLAGAAQAQSQSPSQSPSALPAEVEAALARAKIPASSVSVLVVDAEGRAAPRLAHRAQVPANPASVMKLVTTFAALELLGPAFSWSTPVYVEGAVRDGTLYGNLYLRGQGDPKLVVERLWLLLRRVQGLGVHTLAGDIVLDRSAFETLPADPARFDGEPLRPYNAAPDALLVNYKSVVMTFVPDAAGQNAQVQFDPPLAGVQMQATVPLAAGACNDWRGTLKAEFGEATRIRFAGAYPAACGEKVWPVAYADPASYAARAVEGLWRQMGGTLAGQVREGRVPADLRPTFELTSPTLAEVIRDINKFSNNVMAQQLFLTLSLQQNGTGTVAGSREAVLAWWRSRLPPGEAPTLDNGSGLSRDTRISAQALAHVLQAAWRAPVMPELMASLPITGVDGTLRRSRARSVGTAHLKTGSLRDVTAIAGYVHAASGRRYVLVAIANHPSANAARQAFDALIDWVARDQ